MTACFFGASVAAMGNSAPNEPRRRYARPGEFEIPDSILETNSFSQRLGAELNPSRKGAAPLSEEPRQDVRLNRNPRSPATPVGAQRVSPQSSYNPRSPIPALGRQLPTPAPNPSRRSPPPLISKRVISRVCARFELLPEPKPLWGRIGWSAVAQLGALAFLLLSPTIFPQQMQTALKFDVVELKQPVTHINIEIAPTPPPPPPPKIQPKVQPPELKPVLPPPKPIALESPELSPRQPHVFLVLKPELPKVHKVEAKPVELKPVFQQTEIVLTSNQPARPKEEVKVANLAPGSPAPATVTAPANRVQTGGFGDPNGVSGPGNPNKASNINQAGSPNLPGGAGSGNGSGGAQGTRGTVASDGSKMSAPAAGGATSGVDILYEPNPAYSNEARILKTEGDVMLEVIFLASGQLQVTRVVSGLGHGLDEAAIQAAKQIRFRPARRNGQPIDFPAHVRIEFRLSK